MKENTNSMSLYRKIWMFLIIVLVLLIFLFIFQNWNDISIDLLFYKFDLPVSALIILSIFIGWSISSITYFIKSNRLKDKVSVIQKELDEIYFSTQDANNVGSHE